MDESDLGSSDKQPPSTPAYYAGAYAGHWARRALQAYIHDIMKEVSIPPA